VIKYLKVVAYILTCMHSAHTHMYENAHTQCFLYSATIHINLLYMYFILLYFIIFIAFRTISLCYQKLSNITNIHQQISMTLEA